MRYMASTRFERCIVAKMMTKASTIAHKAARAPHVAATLAPSVPAIRRDLQPNTGSLRRQPGKDVPVSYKIDIEAGRKDEWGANLASVLLLRVRSVAHTALVESLVTQGLLYMCC